MDLQSLWLTNRSLLDEMSDMEYTFKEEKIVKAFFGGTKNMVRMILKHKNNLSYIKQNQLLKIFKKSIPKEISANIINDSKQDLNSNNKNRSVILSDLNQNCITYIFQFLNRHSASRFSVTSRNICIASNLKSCHPNADILTFPIAKMYHFIHKISELQNINENKNNLSTFINEIESLCVWIKNHNPMQYSTNAMVQSGLLETFSDLLTNQNIINNHISLIKNIFFLFRIHTHDHNCAYLLNANIIKNLASLTENIVHKNDEFSRTEIIPLIVCMFADLFFADSSFSSAVWPKIFDTKIGEHIVSILQQPWAICNKDLSWIIAGILLIRDWIYYFPYNEEHIQHYNHVASTAFDDVIPQMMHKISNLIDLKHSKAWIYELLSEDDTVIVRDPVELKLHANDNTSDNANFFYRFKISEIIELPSRNDTEQMVTLIGKFIHSFDINPNQKLVVPVDDIHCVEVNDRTIGAKAQKIYQRLMQVFEAVCGLMLSVNDCHGAIDFKSNKYEKVANEIKHILQTLRTQVPYVFHSSKDVLFTLLRMNWMFFVSFIGDEIETEFTNRDIETIFSLMDIAWSCKNLHTLCEMQWFRTQFCRSRANLTFFSLLNDDFPDHWDDDIYIEILRNFYDDTDAYFLVIEILKKFKFRDNIDLIQEFVNSSGVSWLLKIMMHSFSNFAAALIRNVCRDLILKCKEILVDIFIHLPSPFFLRDQFLKAMDRTTGISIQNIMLLRAMWWQILQQTLIDNKRQEENMKLVLAQMNWFVNQYQMDIQWNAYDFDDTFKEELIKLQSQQFEHKEIMTYLQNIISIVT